MDVAKMVSEQCQKQMAQQNAKMEKSFMESQEKMATKFNGKLSELERKLKSIEVSISRLRLAI
jgi:septal ring factor EnvC (AmiA/AmiB activator)